MIRLRETKKKDNKQSKDSLIQKLVDQIKDLESQVSSLKDELEIERNKPKEGYEEAKRLIDELNEKKQEYQSLMDEVYKLRDSYNEKIKATLEAKTQYEEELSKLISEVKVGIQAKKTITKNELA